MDVTQFLIADFEGLYYQRGVLYTITSTEINFFLITVSASGVILGFLHQYFGGNTGAFLWTAGGLISVLLSMGIITFLRTVEARIQNVVYIRAMNSIRRYFSDIDPSILPYLDMPIRGDIPRFDTIGQSNGILASSMTNSGMIALINASLISVFFLIMIYSLRLHGRLMSLDDGWLALAAFAVWIVAFVVQMSIQVRRLNREERRRRVAA